MDARLRRIEKASYKPRLVRQRRNRKLLQFLVARTFAQWEENNTTIPLAGYEVANQSGAVLLP